MVSRFELANAIRFLTIDAIEKAQSGHPGAPMGMADIAEVLWRDYLKHHPSHPDWVDRDRFVLSNGHGSMLIYSLLHLSGYDLSIEDIKQFRQWHSKTPGHPEYGYTPGVETTTGPLGQGISNAVGMALAEKMLAMQFNRPDHTIVDHYTWVFLGDGCLMEGISHEACSLAGTWKLGKLIAFWDDNGISIDGETAGWFTDDTPKRFEAYGWQVIRHVDGHDAAAIAQAIEQAKHEIQRPTLICCKTIIGCGAPHKQGSAQCHGAPLGTAEVAETRAALHWPYPVFEIPDDIYQAWDARPKGEVAMQDWKTRFAAYEMAYPDLAAEFARRQKGCLPEAWDTLCQHALNQVCEAAQTVATRKASQMALEVLSPDLPELVGGSADLTGSNLTNWSGSEWLTSEGKGNYISYGVREFGMAAIMNGLTLHGGLRPYGGTFLMFSEYARNAIRMAALMKINPIFVFTHDSIGLGEDGPTHQPVEQLATLRYIPNHHAWRPCDTAETMVAWQQALKAQQTPTSLVLSRQNLPFIQRNAEQMQAIARGGYILRDTETPKAVLIATGSEVALALQAQEALGAEHIAVRVVSMPSTTIFDQQEATWQQHVLPDGVVRLAIEAGHGDFWRKYVGLSGGIISMDCFGESAPANQLFQQFGFTVDHVVNQVKALLR